MTAVLLYPLICLLTAIALVVLLTTRYKVPAFFALILSAFMVGLSVQMPIGLVTVTIKDGFGNILKLLGIVIVLGTTLGVMLEYTGSTAVMAAFILKKTGEKQACASSEKKKCYFYPL